MRPITAALVVAAAVGLAAAAQVILGRETPALETDAVAAATLLEAGRDDPVLRDSLGLRRDSETSLATAGIEARDI